MTMPLWTQCCSKPLALLVIIWCAGCSKQPAQLPATIPSFSQDRAYARLVELCDLGPRNYGSEGKRKAEELIKRVLREAGAEVLTHEFQHTAAGTSEAASFRNIVGRIKPQEKRRVLFGTHYDTRTWADKDPHEELRNNPINGANDGASGVAVLLEMAIAWKDHPPPIGIDLIFFDGEDFGWAQNWNDYFLGSKAWVRDHPDYQAEWGVIVDMVGDASLRISKERESLAKAPAVVQRIWDAASRVGVGAFVDETGGRILDDHTAFLDKGLPVVLLIDFQYRWFHTTEDTPDKCSAESLGQIGLTLFAAVEGS
jgi:peptidase M28-like protein